MAKAAVEIPFDAEGINKSDRVDHQPSAPESTLTPQQRSRLRREGEIAAANADVLEKKIADAEKIPEQRRLLNQHHGSLDHARIEAISLRSAVAGIDQKIAYNEIKELLQRIPLRLEIGAEVFLPDQDGNREPGWVVTNREENLGMYELKLHDKGASRLVSREMLEPEQPPLALTPRPSDFKSGKVMTLAVRLKGSQELDPGWVVARLDQNTKRVQLVKEIPPRSGKEREVYSKRLSFEEVGELIAEQVKAGAGARVEFEMTKSELMALLVQKDVIVSRMEAARQRALGNAKERAQAHTAERLEEPRYQSGDEVVIQHPEHGWQVWAVKSFDKEKDVYIVWARVKGLIGKEKVESEEIPRKELEELQRYYSPSGAKIEEKDRKYFE